MSRRERIGKNTDEISRCKYKSRSCLELYDLVGCLPQALLRFLDSPTAPESLNLSEPMMSRDDGVITVAMGIPKWNSTAHDAARDSQSGLVSGSTMYNSITEFFPRAGAPG